MDNDFLSLRKVDTRSKACNPYDFTGPDINEPYELTDCIKDTNLTANAGTYADLIVVFPDPEGTLCHDTTDTTAVEYRHTMHSSVRLKVTFKRPHVTDTADKHTSGTVSLIPVVVDGKEGFISGKAHIVGPQSHS